MSNRSKTISFAKNFADAGIFFPAANVFNFMQGANPVATKIAIANLLYSALLIGTSSALKNLPEKSRMRTFQTRISQAINDKTATNNPLKLAFRLVGREISNPLRVTSYCALAVSAFLLVSAAGGSAAALFPGLAGLFFGIGNFIQSSPALTRFRNNSKTSPLSKALLHPAVWYGIGYTMTGIGIGGGMSLLLNPLRNIGATLLTSVGVAETTGALGLMISGKVKNQAAPFVGVAVGTAFFAMAGLATGNLLGMATGILACAGETSLAILMQKIHNMTDVAQNNVSKVEKLLTAPIRMAMNRGWIKSVPTIS